MAAALISAEVSATDEVLWENKLRPVWSRFVATWARG